MPIDVEINLRIPAVKEPAKDPNGYPINSADVRFIRDISVEAIPKPGVMLTLATKDGLSLECEVHRADWSEGKQRFVVYCKYSKRSIPPSEYHALLSDPDWAMRPLL
jgi:hypothetical protein